MPVSGLVVCHVHKPTYYYFYSMKKNMGTTDRVIRAIFAFIIILLYFTGHLHYLIGDLLLVVAVMFAFTSLTAFCPMYALLGLSTLPIDKRHRRVS